MSDIFKQVKLEQTNTQGQIALDLFQDRVGEIRRFLGYLNDPEPHRKILFFYGDGGNGKSLLLRYLRAKSCKRFSNQENWAYISSCPDEELKAHLLGAESAVPVPTALLDFGQRPIGDDRPQEALYALLMLQRQLAGSGLRFPLFTFACIWPLHATGRLTEDRLRALLPAEVWDLGFELVSTFREIPYGQIANKVLLLMGKHLQTDYTMWAAKRGLPAGWVQHIQQWERDSQLLDHVPALFAADLNSAMERSGEPIRVVLFFDAHDAFWGEGKRRMAGDQYAKQDEWLRLLLTNIRPELGIVAVVAGREPPSWGEAAAFKGPFVVADSLRDEVPVGSLPRVDALAYLEDERTGVADPAMREFLLDFARQDAEHVHPLLLGLGADIVRTAAAAGKELTPAMVAAEAGESKLHRLIQLLMRYADHDIAYAVQALAACRSFTYSLYGKLGAKLDFQPSKPAFGLLTRYSFVWNSGEAGQYRIHDLLRRLLRETQNEVTTQADAVLEAHYRELAETGDEAALVEAIYHANSLDWEPGASEWVDQMEAATEESRYGLGLRLLGLRPHLTVMDPWTAALMSHCAGDYYAGVARHADAERELRAACGA